MKVTSCCGYELMYKGVGEDEYELWEFCGMCLKYNWEEIELEEYDKKEKNNGEIA